MGSSYREEVNEYKMKKNSPCEDRGMPHVKKKHKKNKKSNHKHKYIPAIYHMSYVGINSNEKHIHTTCGSHCAYCGRVSDMYFMWSREEERVQRFKEEYPNYVEVTLPEGWDYFKDKFVPI